MKMNRILTTIGYIMIIPLVLIAIVLEELFGGLFEIINDGDNR